MGKTKTRERIVESAYKCFSEKGYIGTTTKEISKLAGISEVTLFRYFRSKKELFEEVLDKFSVLPDIEKIKMEKSLPIEKKLEKVAEEIIRSLKEKKNFIKILLSEISPHSEEVSEIYREFISRLDSIIAEILSSDRETARLFHSSLFGYFLSEEIFLESEIDDRKLKGIVKKLVELFTERRGEEK
ncbi:MAG: TetR/AcrR family transcriptional regulator [Desulfurobacteriaceae bacterium]